MDGGGSQRPLFIHKLLTIAEDITLSFFHKYCKTALLISFFFFFFFFFLSIQPIQSGESHLTKKNCFKDTVCVAGEKKKKEHKSDITEAALYLKATGWNLLNALKQGTETMKHHRSHR